MDDYGFVGVDNSLRISCRARSVAYYSRILFIKFGPGVIWVPLFQKVDQELEAIHSCRNLVLLRASDVYSLDALEKVSVPDKYPDIGRIYEENPVTGVIYDVNDLIREQSGVDSVSHPPES